MSEPAIIVDEGDSDLDQSDTHPTRYPAIPVSVEGIARVRSLPARRGVLGSVAIANDGIPVRIVGRNDQRLSLMIQPDGDIQLFADQPPPTGSTAGFPLGAGIGLSMDYTGEIWGINTGAAAVTVGTAQTLVEE